MKPSDVLNYVNAVKPSAYEDNVKMVWLDHAEANVLTQIHGVSPSDVVAPSQRDDPDGDLTVPAPYDELYALYLIAQIDSADGEVYQYNNSATMYNVAFLKYAAWYVRNNRPSANTLNIFL